jgi:hypothetical protein
VELRTVYAARRVELERSTNGVDWIEKKVFISMIVCPNCYDELPVDNVKELGIEGY